MISNWNSATWQVSLNGNLLASSLQPQGAQAIASYDATAKRLVIQYLGTIATTATTAQRTFAVSSAAPPTATTTATATSDANQHTDDPANQYANQHSHGHQHVHAVERQPDTHNPGRLRHVQHPE